MIDRMVGAVRTAAGALAVAFFSVATAFAAPPLGGWVVELDEAQREALQRGPDAADLAVWSTRRSARSLAERKLHAALARAHTAVLAGQHDLSAAAGLPAALVDGTRVLVEIRHEVRGRDADALPGLQELGADIRNPGHRGLTEAWVPAQHLDQLATLPDVQHVAPARLVRTLASVTTQGIAAGAVVPWHLAALDGSNVTIAIIDRFANTGGEVAALQGSGDWPPVERLTLVKVGAGTFGDNGDAHGNATLEVAFDVAPGADFIAYDVLTVGDWRDAIDLAVVAGAQVISTSLGASLDGIGDGSALPGSVAERVEAAAAAGVLYVNAAGNAREQHWGGVYVPSTNANFLTWSGVNTRFNPFGDGQGNVYCLPDGLPLIGELFWDDWGNVDHDYDLFLYEFVDDDDLGMEIWKRIAESNDEQNGAPGQRPQERIEWVASSIDDSVNICGPGAGLYGWRIGRIGAATDRNLQFFANVDLAHRVHARSLVFPADSPAALAVAAIDVATLAQALDSSEGPSLAPGGGLPNGGEFAKPDVASFADVDTVSFGPGAFGGTSAAAAHVAGMAVLLKQRHPDFDRDALAQRLRDIAGLDANELGDPGHDARFGWGRLRWQSEVALAVVGSPGTTEADTLLAPVEVELRDDAGVAVLSGPTTMVTVSIGNDPSAGAATLSGTSVLPLVDGFVAFTDLSIDTPGFAYTLTFAANSDVAGAESAPFNIVFGGPGVPSQLVFSVQPSTSEAGSTLLPVVTVEVQDSQGALVVTDQSTDISLVLVDDPGNSGLAGAGPVVVSNGVATFPALSLDRAGSGYRLHAQSSVPGLIGVDSGLFDIVPGAPTRLTVLNPPGNAAIGAALPTIEVAVTDALGNPQAADNATEVVATLFANPGDASLSGTLTRIVSAGVAHFDDLSLDAAGIGFTLLFSADIGPLEEALVIDDFSLGALQSTLRHASGGVDNQALVRGLRFTGTVSGIGGNSSFASDLRMDVSGPSGSSFAVGGLNTPAPVLWDFNGPVSTADGTYISTHEMIFSSFQGPWTVDVGTWQFQFRNDWGGAPAAMHWTNVSIDLLKDDLYVISGAFAIGIDEAVIDLQDLVQSYDGTPRAVTVVTDPPDLMVEVTYDGDPQPPVDAGIYAVLVTVTEPNWFGSANAALEVARAATITTLESNANPAVVGTDLILTAVVSGVDPTGSVSFFVGAVAIPECGDLALSGLGPIVSAQCLVGGLSVGEHAFSVEYDGDPNHLPSGGEWLQGVEPYVTTLVLDELESSADRGAPASFAATLEVPVGAVFDPTGTLILFATQGMDSETCQVAVAAAGSHGCDITFVAPAAGIFTISAAFIPDNDHFADSVTIEDGTHSVLRVADLAIAKASDPVLTSPGEALDFIIEVDNLGPDEAVAVNVLDALPTGFLSAVWVCEPEGGALCSDADGVGDLDQVVDMPASGRLIYTISGVLDTSLALPLFNQAMVVTTDVGFTRDPNLANNSANVSVGAYSEAVFADGFEAP